MIEGFHNQSEASGIAQQLAGEIKVLTLLTDDGRELAYDIEGTLFQHLM